MHLINSMRKEKNTIKDKTEVKALEKHKEQERNDLSLIDSEKR